MGGTPEAEEEASTPSVPDLPIQKKVLHAGKGNLPKFADWPTFPQVYINGEFVGGCDITLELHEKGELKKMIDDANA